MLKKQLILTSTVFWVCVVIINIIRSPASDFSLQEDAFWSGKISWTGCFDIAAAGDSRTLIGISPQTMHSILPGYKIGNLGFAALIYSQEYLDYVRTSLKEPVSDKIIVLGFSPRSLLQNEKPDCYFYKWKNVNRMPFLTAINKNSGWLRSLFRELGVDDLKIDFNPADGSKWLMICLESGWVASRYFPERPNGSRGTYRTAFLRNKIDESLLETIYKNTAAWTREGIRVFGVRIPASNGLMMIENQISGFNEKEIRYRFEQNGGIWLSPSSYGLITHDGSHLRYDSAIYYSQNLANELKKYMHVKK